MYGRHDALINDVTGLGDQSLDTLDTRQRTVRCRRSWRPTHHWEGEWLESWTARREVSQLAFDMVREGLRLEGLPDWVNVRAVMSYVEADINLGVDGTLDRSPGLLWHLWRLKEVGDKVGGAVVMPILEDGLDPIHPLDTRRIKRVVGWHVFDRSQLTPFSYSGTQSVPEFYVLSDVLGIPNAHGIRPKSAAGPGHRIQPGDIIHRSRLGFNLGVLLNPREMQRRWWWGASKLELNESSRFNLEYGDENLGTYLDRASWIHYSLAGLQELRGLCDDAGNNIGEDAVRKHFREVRRLARSMGLLLTDGGKPTVGFDTGLGSATDPGRNADKVESIAESSGNLVEMNKYFRDQWQAGAGIPRSIAFGEAPSGLRGGKNEGDWQSWSGLVSSDQELWGSPIMKWMLLILFASKDGPTNGVIPDPDLWSIKWLPLLKPTPLEAAQIADARATADGKRLEQRVIRVDEVRKQRVEDGDTDGQLKASDIEIDEDLPPALVGHANLALEVGKLIHLGEITPAYGAFVLRKSDPIRFKDDADDGVSLASRPYAPDTTDPARADQPAEEPPDPLTTAFAGMSKNLKSAKDIAAELTRAYGLGWTPQRVHRVAREHGLDKQGFGTLRGYPFEFFQQLALGQLGPTPDADDAHGCPVAVEENHGHALVIPQADVSSATPKQYDITGEADHGHTVALGVEDFASLASGSEVRVESSVVNEHSHAVVITCAAEETQP